MHGGRTLHVRVVSTSSRPFNIILTPESPLRSKPKSICLGPRGQENVHERLIWLEAPQIILRLLEIVSAVMKDCRSGIQAVKHYRAAFGLTGQRTQEDQHKNALLCSAMPTQKCITTDHNNSAGHFLALASAPPTENQNSTRRIELTHTHHNILLPLPQHPNLLMLSSQARAPSLQG